jgi:hypothetical protein
MGGNAGDWGTSNVVRVIRSEVLVLRLSWLGFLRIEGTTGLMKAGDAGSLTSADESELKGGWIERPFIFFALRGPGEVMGRAGAESETVKPAMPGSPPNEVALNEDSGTRLMGESGDDEGDGSDIEQESVHEAVVVGEDSADSDV